MLTFGSAAALVLHSYHLLTYCLHYITFLLLRYVAAPRLADPALILLLLRRGPSPCILWIAWNFALRIVQYFPPEY